MAHKIKIQNEEVEENVLVEQDVPQEAVVDRELNCPDCKGEGLDVNSRVCPRCLGTGKVE